MWNLFAAQGLPMAVLLRCGITFSGRRTSHQLEGRIDRLHQVSGGLVAADRRILEITSFEI